MKTFLLATAALAIGAATAAQAADTPPVWAWGFTTPPPAVMPPPAPAAAPAPLDNKTEHTLPGSQLKFTRAQIANRYGPADWFPEDHPTMPDIVAHGRESAQPTVYACSLCHYKIRLIKDEVFTTGGPISPLAKGDPIALMQADKAHVGVLNGTYATNLDQRTATYFTSLGLSIAGTGRASQLYSQTTVYMCSPKLYTLRYLVARGVITSGNQISFNAKQCQSYQGIDVIVALGSDWVPKLPPNF